MNSILIKLLALSVTLASSIAGAVPVTTVAPSKVASTTKKFSDPTELEPVSFDGPEYTNTIIPPSIFDQEKLLNANVTGAEFYKPEDNETTLPTILDDYIDTSESKYDGYIVSFNLDSLPKVALRGRRLETLGIPISEYDDESGNVTSVRQISAEDYESLDPSIKKQATFVKNDLFSMQYEAFDRVASELTAPTAARVMAKTESKATALKVKASKVVSAKDAFDGFNEQFLPQGFSDSISGDGKFTIAANPNAKISPVTIFILDSGVNAMPSIFGSRLQQGTSFANGFWENAPGVGDAVCLHGSHVAATAAGNLSGFARNALVYPVRVLDSKCGGSASGVIAGIDHAIKYYKDQKKQGNKILPIMNLSLDSVQNDAVDAAVARAEAAGFIVIACAGNHNIDARLASPAAASKFSPNIITVGSVTATTAKSGFSNYGDRVSIYAFGSLVTAAVQENADGGVVTMVMSGTSMSAPQVAGIVGDIWEKHPSWTKAQVVNELYKLTRKLENSIVAESSISPPFKSKKIAQMTQEPLVNVALQTIDTGFRIPEQSKFSPLSIGQSLRLEFNVAAISPGNIFKFGLFSDPIPSLIQPDSSELNPKVGSVIVTVPKLTKPGKYSLQVTRQANENGKSTYWLEITGNGLNFPMKLRLDNNKRALQYWGVSSTKPGLAVQGFKQQIVTAKATAAPKPTKKPTSYPTKKPTPNPTRMPTKKPTSYPTKKPKQ